MAGIHNTDIYDEDFAPGDDMSEHMPQISSHHHSIKNEIILTKVNQFYQSLDQQPPEVLDPNDFEIDSNDHLHYKTKVGGKVHLTNKRDSTKFLEASTLRQRLNIEDQHRLGIRKQAELKQEAVAQLQNLQSKIPNVDDVPLQNLNQTTNQLIEEINETVLSENTELKTVNDSPLPMREILALDKRLQSIRGELTNNLARLRELDEHINREKEKIVTADEENLGLDIKNRILHRLDELQQERSARLEALSAVRDDLRTQVNRIKETVQRVLHENTTLMERIKTLFKEQGITIASIITAIGFAISTLVYALTGTSGSKPSPNPSPNPSPSQSWVKKQLDHLKNLLKRLAEKVLDSIPGLLGSVLSFVLSAASKVVGVMADHLWTLLVGIGVLLLSKVKNN